MWTSILWPHFGHSPVRTRGTSFGPVRAGEVEIVATADTGANLPMKHADIVVDRIDHVAREEYRDAGGSRCSLSVTIRSCSCWAAYFNIA